MTKKDKLKNENQKVRKERMKLKKNPSKHKIVGEGFATFSLKYPTITDYGNGVVWREHNKRVALIKKEKDDKHGYVLNFAKVDEALAKDVAAKKKTSVFSGAKRGKVVVNEIHLSEESMKQAMILYFRQCNAEQKLSIIETALTGNPMYPFTPEIVAVEWKWDGNKEIKK